jgi:nucleoside 2-deoxyribosyltransferase
MTIHVVGGVYSEYCVRPEWNNLYGSAGRAAVAIARMDAEVSLHSYFTKESGEQFEADFIWYDKLQLVMTPAEKLTRFWYMHDSAPPSIAGRPAIAEPAIAVNERKVVRFGILDGDAVVHADWAVYDPQNMGAVTSFSANGSTAKHLALVLNAYEAQAMANAFGQSPQECAKLLAEQQGAEVVIIKMGPSGALVWANGHAQTVPAYKTSNVWKIGSGDCFVAHFALAWMNEGCAPHVAAERASRATAYYCERMTLPTRDEMKGYAPQPVEPSADFTAGTKRQVYLAGPFFDLAQVWIVEEARRNLLEVGLKVFSPVHEIGYGKAQQVVQQDLDAIKASDIVFAIADGLDAGTLYEIGYARALGKPVVVYSERESDESLKMAEGSDCIICRNYTTALYSTLWKAAEI